MKVVPRVNGAPSRPCLPPPPPQAMPGSFSADDAGFHFKAWGLELDFRKCFQSQKRKPGGT